MKNEETYLPLNNGLEITKSKIHGHGLFATEAIKANTSLGTSHILLDDDGELIRTPLGGLYNHSETPNCVKVQVGNTRHSISWQLMTIKDIKPGEEITVKYTFYKIK